MAHTLAVTREGEDAVRRSTILAALIAVLLAAPPPAARSALYPAGDPGVGARTLKIGGVLDQTGRGSILALPILGGYRLAFKEVNATGGVNGRTVDYVAGNDNYDPGQTLAQIKQVVESDGVFAVAGVFGSDDANVAAPYLESHHVPFFDPIGGGVDLRGKQWIWQTEPSYVTEGKVMARFAGTALHAKRVAILYQVGIGEAQAAALRQTLPKYGASLVAEAPYEVTATNMSGQVAHLRASNPDLIVLNGIPTATAAFVQYARLVGYRPKDGFLANYAMDDPLWIALIGVTNAEGNYVSGYADLTGHNPMATRFRRAIAKYNGPKYTNAGLYGYFNAQILIHALRLAGRHLSRARLQDVLDHDFRRYDSGLTGQLTWTPTQRYGVRQFKMYRIHNGAYLPATGWLSP
jgi:ABC-type branched-subunit amino acid transport system substrate-binding protein